MATSTQLSSRFESVAKENETLKAKHQEQADLIDELEQDLATNREKVGKLEKLTKAKEEEVCISYV